MCLYLLNSQMTLIGCYLELFELSRCCIMIRPLVLAHNFSHLYNSIADLEVEGSSITILVYISRGLHANECCCC